MGVNLRQISTLKNMPVIDLETGSVLSRIVSWVVRPRDQQVAAFLLDRTFPFQKWPVIVPTDIAEYGPKMVVARDKEVVIVSQEVIGLPELISKKMTFTGFRAETDTGKKLGVVDDLVFDTITSRIQKYYIRPQGLTGITGSTLILSADKVVEIKKHRLIFTNEAAVRVSTASQRTRAAQKT